MQNNKPLKVKNYGSIGHLPSSRLGEGDHHVTIGEAAICCEKVRDRHDKVFISEKLDGSNVGVAKVGGAILALSRAGYLAETSPYEMHHYFARWVEKRSGIFASLLEEGQRIVGEWLLQAHGTRYTVGTAEELFVAFDMFTSGNRRLPHALVYDKAKLHNIRTATVFHEGALPVEAAMAKLGIGYHGAMDETEGVVYRHERKGEFGFLAKFVRHDKVDGCYLPPKDSGAAPVWNFPPEEI